MKIFLKYRLLCKTNKIKNNKSQFHCTVAIREHFVCVGMHFLNSFFIILCSARPYCLLFSPLSVCFFTEVVSEVIDV